MTVNSPASDVAQLLQAAGVGQVAAPTGWSIWTSNEQPFEPGRVPHTMITLYDTGGFDSRAGWSEEHPTVQARIRGAPEGYPPSYPVAYAKAYEIKQLAMQTDLAPMRGFFYSLRVIGDINPLGNDDQSRPIFTVNFHVMRSVET